MNFEEFFYNSDTGKLYRETGCLDHHNGYTTIGYKGKYYSAARLAWYLYYKEWPNQIDHINGNRSDNRICNLRNVTSKQNNQNLKCHREGHLLGTCYRRENNTWRMRTIRGTYIGKFKTQQEAHEAYLNEVNK